jgi:hypothetical protein
MRQNPGDVLSEIVNGGMRNVREERHRQIPQRAAGDRPAATEDELFKQLTVQN